MNGECSHPCRDSTVMCTEQYLKIGKLQITSIHFNCRNITSSIWSDLIYLLWSSCYGCPWLSSCTKANKSLLQWCRARHLCDSVLLCMFRLGRVVLLWHYQRVVMQSFKFSFHDVARHQQLQVFNFNKVVAMGFQTANLRKAHIWCSISSPYTGNYILYLTSSPFTAHSNCFESYRVIENIILVVTCFTNLF